METGNIIIRLIADMREFVGNLDRGEAKIAEFGASAETMGTRFEKGMKRASTAVLATGLAVAAYGVKSAYDYVEALDKLRTQAGASAAELEYVKSQALAVSDATNQSSESIVAGYLQVEKAGIRGAKATELVTKAAMAATITGGQLTDVVGQLVAAQTIQNAKGMSVAQVTDLIVKANQMHMGSLNSLFSVLSGRVGVALSAHNVSLAQAAAISNIAAMAGYTNTRSLATLATSLGKVEAPTKSYAKSLAAVGLNANTLAADAKKPGGLLNVLKDVEAASRRTGQSVSQVADAVFGSGGGALATVLVRNLPTLLKQTATLGGASGADLTSQFGISQSQLGQRIAALKNQLKNALTGLGLLLLPAVSDVTNWVTNTVKYFREHPLIEKIATDAAIGVFVAAIVSKLTSGIRSVVSVFQGLAQTNYLREIALNTQLLVDEGATGGKRGLGGILSGFFGGALRSLGELGANVAVAYTGIKGAENVFKFFTDPKWMAAVTRNNPINSFFNWITGGNTPPSTTPTPLFPGSVLPYGPTRTGGPVTSTAVVRVH